MSLVKRVALFMSFLVFSTATYGTMIQATFYTNNTPVGTGVVSVENGIANFNFTQDLHIPDYRLKIYYVLFNVNPRLDRATFDVTSGNTALPIFTRVGDPFTTDHFNYTVGMGSPIHRPSADLLPESFNFSIGNLPLDTTPYDFFISNSLFSSHGLTAEFEMILLADSSDGTASGTTIVSSTVIPPISDSVPEPNFTVITLGTLTLIVLKWRRVS